MTQTTNDRRFRAECALVDQLDGLIPSGAAARLDAARAEIERAVTELLNVGRRRGLAEVMAELEYATARLDQTELPPDARRQLTRLLATDVVAS